jgi:hypothetical protein
MGVLKTVAPEAATGEVARIYEGIKKGFGSVPAAFKVEQDY